MADSGGPAAFAADDGSVPAEVAAALTRHGQGTAGQREVVGVLAHHRLLVPLLEVDADSLEGDDADPCAGQDRAVAAVSMRTRAGTLGLAFSGIDPLLAWDRRARPMPVTAQRVAAALVGEGAAGLVLDPAGPATCRLGRVALRRLAAGGDWPDPWLDPDVRAAVVAELAPALAAGELQVRLAPPDDAASGLAVEVRLPGVPPEVAAQRARVVAERLAGSAGLRDAFDGVIEMRLVD